MKPEEPTINWLRIIIQSTALAVVMVILPIILCIGIGVFVVFNTAKPFFVETKTTPQLWIEKIKTAWNAPVVMDNGKFNFLLLGVDSLPNRKGDGVLTDTIILGSLNPAIAELHLLSIPRDLWSEAYQAKINSLFQYGYDADPTLPYALLHKELSDTTGVPIHSTLSISLTSLAELIDLLGGIRLTIPVGFIDKTFPRSDVDIKVIHDPKLLYQQVEFESGEQTLSGLQATQYIRSRHGNNNQNTDDARTIRQQLVLDALSKKIINKETLTNPSLLAKLWIFYEQNFSKQLPFETIVGIARSRIETVGWQKSIGNTISKLSEVKITQQTLPVATKNGGKIDMDSGVIYNPTINKNKYQGQWVYIITEPSTYRTYVQKSLGFTQ